MPRSLRISEHCQSVEDDALGEELQVVWEIDFLKRERPMRLFSEVLPRGAVSASGALRHEKSDRCVRFLSASPSMKC